MASLQELQPAIVRIGERLAALAGEQTPALFDRKRWFQSAMTLAMKDPVFKTRLFRFIDVLPAVTDDARLVSLAEEYFDGLETPVFGMQWGLKALGATSFGARLTGKTLRQQIEQMATLFIVGASPEAAGPGLASLWRHGRAWSVDLLGEATITETEADRYRDHCVEALRTLHRTSTDWPAAPLLEQDHLGPLPRVQLSLKISALTSRLDPIDPEGCYQTVAVRLRAIVDLAMSLQAGVIFDMEQADTKDVLLDIFTRLFSESTYRTYAHAGVALQAYHRGTEHDIQRLLAWVRTRGTPITIRLVKGAYWDSDTVRYRQAGWPVPLYEHKAETDRCYESLVLLLLEQTSLVRPAFGTHNLRTLAVIEAAAASRGLSPDAWEYQMIYGMAEPLQQALVTLGRRLRLYTPVGQLLPGMAYLVRRLIENTSNESFLRKEYVESQSLASLLAPPSGSPPSQTATASEEAADFHNEPYTDFSQAAARTAMQGAVAAVHAQLGRTWDGTQDGLVLNGPPLASRNPAHPDQVVGLLPSASEENVATAVQTALTASDEWPRRPTSERIAVIRRAAAMLRVRRYELTAWEIVEVGKPWREADADVAEAIDFLEFYAGQMGRLTTPLRLGRYPGELNQRWYRPRGLTAVIAPWNFPLAIPAGMVSAALVAGNRVLFKPSERAPVLGWLLAELFWQAGVPPTALRCLPGGGNVGRALAGRPELATVAFTGSRTVGLHLLAGAATVPDGQRHVQRVIAEMGGKNAIIIDETADLDEAIVGVMASFTGYAGQKCSACSRAIVLEPAYEPFLARLREAVMSLRIGDPCEPGTQMGPVVDERAKQRIDSFIAQGEKECRLVVRRAHNGAGYYVGPVVFADVRPHHRIAQEEIFGPVLAVMKASSMADALRLANDTDYALTGGVYSRSPANLALASEQFDVGNLYLNRPITGALVGRQPFGGHRLSGVGAKAGGEDYLPQFMVSRVISEQTIRRGFEAAD